MARRKEPESAVYAVLSDDGVVVEGPVAIHPDVAVPENWVAVDPGATHRGPDGGALLDKDGDPKQMAAGWRTADGGETWTEGDPLPEPRDELGELRARLAALEARLA